MDDSRVSLERSVLQNVGQLLVAAAQIWPLESSDDLQKLRILIEDCAGIVSAWRRCNANYVR